HKINVQRRRRKRAVKTVDRLFPFLNPLSRLFIGLNCLTLSRMFQLFLEFSPNSPTGKNVVISILFFRSPSVLGASEPSSLAIVTTRNCPFVVSVDVGAFCLFVRANVPCSICPIVTASRTSELSRTDRHTDCVRFLSRFFILQIRFLACPEVRRQV